MENLGPKIDRLTLLLEDHANQHLRQSPFSVTRDLITNTVLASIVGYFMFRILDHYFKKTKR